MSAVLSAVSLVASVADCAHASLVSSTVGLRDVLMVSRQCCEADFSAGRRPDCAALCMVAAQGVTF